LRQTQTAANIGNVPYELTYNLFRRRGKSDLHCAVPQDHPVPPFVEGFFWEFAGTLGEKGFAPAEFDRPAASIGIRLIGFYLFQMARSTDNGVPDLALAA
jgi:hypothetical protein